MGKSIFRTKHIYIHTSICESSLKPLICKYTIAIFIRLTRATPGSYRTAQEIGLTPVRAIKV